MPSGQRILLQTIEAKKTLYKLLYSELKKLGYQDKDYLLLLYEPSLDYWGWAGKSAREIDLGFSLEV